MTFAICLQVPNHLHFKKRTSIFTEFIPQVIFLHSIFGYLVVCIIYKWLVDWSKSPTPPPNLLNMLINMFLSPGKVEDPLYAGQAGVQTCLLLLAVVCVPWMLCTKPYLVWQEKKKREAEGYRALGEGTAPTNGRRYSDDAGEGEERADPSTHHGEEVRFCLTFPSHPCPTCMRILRNALPPPSGRARGGRVQRDRYSPNHSHD